MVAGEFEARDFVFVDECGSHTSLSPIYGYSPRGERLVLEVPRNGGKNTTLLASLTTPRAWGSAWRWKGLRREGPL